MDKYKCINGVFSARQRQIFRSLPVKDGVYTLKQVVNSPIDNKEGWIFEELNNPCHPNGQEFSFRPSRFVPLDSVDINSLIEADIHYQ